MFFIIKDVCVIIFFEGVGRLMGKNLNRFFFCGVFEGFVLVEFLFLGSEVVVFGFFFMEFCLWEFC